MQIGFLASGFVMLVFMSMQQLCGALQLQHLMQASLNVNFGRSVVRVVVLCLVPGQSKGEEGVHFPDVPFESRLSLLLLICAGRRLTNTHGLSHILHNTCVCVCIK